jgi:hypothetical protein
MRNRYASGDLVAVEEIPADSLQGGVFSITDRSGGHKTGMPPGSIYLYVFDALPPHPHPSPARGRGELLLDAR